MNFTLILDKHHIMRRILFALLCGSSVFMGCNYSASDEKSSVDTTATTTPPPVDSVAAGLAGVYHGYLPCPDCKGIITYLLLNPDRSFRLEETFFGKSDSLVLTTGKWTSDNGNVVLMEGNNARLSYQPEQNRLWQLDYQGNRISGNLGDKYQLTRQPRAESKHLQDKADAGIDFVAVGNEPFWSLEIEKGKNFIFNRPGLETPDSIAYAEPVMVNNTRQYHVQSGSTTLDLVVSPQFCSDGMSDFVYEYKVELTYNKKKYSGCGRLLSEL